MTKFLGFAAAALLAGSAGAQQMPKAPAPAVPEAVKAAPEAAKETVKEAKALELSGELKAIDVAKRSVTVAPATGLSKDFTIAETATIMRDGNKATLDQLQAGDEVRATYDATTNHATMLEVHSKQIKK